MTKGNVKSVFMKPWGFIKICICDLIFEIDMEASNVR
jgi:hypothetical protein